MTKLYHGRSEIGCGGVVRPFEGIKVIDLTHVLAGPFCAYQLAVLGAEIVKVEPPGRPDQAREGGSDKDLNKALMGTLYLTQGSNKRSVTLNLKTNKGQGILKRMVRDADVMIENYRAGAMINLGLGYEDMKAVNPRLIYCSMTGFGQTGPKGDHTSYDQIIQAASGLMSLIGTPENTPFMVGAPVIDYASGTMAAFAVTSALFQRTHTGRGQFIDFSMLDAALLLMSSTVVAYLHNGRVPAPSGNQKLYAGNSCYETKDGLIMLGAFNRRQHEAMWNILGYPDLAELSNYDDMETHRERLAATLSRILLDRTALEWEDFFNRAHVPAARVRTVPEALGLEQINSRNLLQTLDDVPGMGTQLTVPIAGFTFAYDGPSVETPPPQMGAHTNQVLAEIGYSEEEIDSLREEGII